jgi:hypothetical protein
MGKGPKGGRPPGRRGGAGSGPSGTPRVGGTGRGSSHKGGTSSGSSGGANSVVLLAAAIPLALMALAILSTGLYVVFA